MVRAAALTCLALLLSGCGETEKADKIDLTLLRTKVDIMETRLSRLEGRQVPDYATFKPSTDTWSWIEWQGVLLRVGISDIEKRGNGSRVKLSIINPQAVALSECTLGVAWAETDKAGNVVQSTLHDEVIRISIPFPAGSFAQPYVDLPDIAPDRLGHIAVGRPDCLRTSS